MPTNIILTTEQEQLKVMMILKYGDLTDAFWSDDTFTPEENKILEYDLMGKPLNGHGYIERVW